MAGARVVPDLSLWSQFQRIGGSLTPLQVTNIIRQADGGQMAPLMDLANDSRQKDSTLQAVLAQSEECIAGLEWQLELPDRPKRKEKKATEFIDQYLRSSAAFYRLIAHLAGAVYYGHGVAETVWVKDAGRLVPGTFECLAARRFGYRHTDGTFVLRDEGMPDVGVDIFSQYPSKFVVSRPRVTGDVPCREGLVRVLVWAALFRNWTLTDWLRTGEISWKPWRIGKYAPGTEEESIADLAAILDGMSTNGVAVVPTTTEIDVKWAPNASTKASHSELFETIAREMAKCVLGQTETTQSSASSGYAQAKVHNEVRKDLREARARSIAFDLTRDVIVPMCLINFGDGVRPPRLRFVTDDAVDLKAFSEGVKNLSEAGTKIPQSWVREEAGIPDPKGDEELLKPAATPDTGDSADGDADTDPPDTPTPDTEGEEKAHGRKEKGRRKATKSETGTRSAA